MALIKKAKPADAVAEDDEATAVDAEAAFEADAAALAAVEEESNPEPTLTVVDAEPTEPEAEEAASGNDDLMSMFTEVGIETVDLSVLTNLAGEVDMTDLISELHIVAAALGIVRAQQEAASAAFEEEQLAA